MGVRGRGRHHKINEVENPEITRNGTNKTRSRDMSKKLTSVEVILNFPEGRSSPFYWSDKNK